MNRTERRLAWVAFGTWMLLCFALQGWLAQGAGASWFPELGLLLLIALVARMEERDAWIAGALAAFLRASVSGEPPIVQLSALLGLALLVLVLRSSLEIEAPLLRGALALFGVLATDLWMCLARLARAWWAGAGLEGLRPPLLPLLSVAISSGICALLLGPLLAHLPGLSPLRSRRW